MARRALQFVATSAILIGCSVYDVSLVDGALGGPAVNSGAGSSNSTGGNGGDGPSAGTGPAVGNGGRPGVTVPTGGRAGESSGGADPTGGSGGSETNPGGMGGDTDPGGGAGGFGGSGGAGGAIVDTGGVGGTTSGGSSGTGGSGGLAGGGTPSGGNGGMGGMGGVGGAGGAGGNGGNGGVGGSPTFAGCAVLTTALDATADKAHFLITLAADTDFTGATVSVHAHAEGALGGSVYLYLQQSTFEYWGGAATDLTDLSGWETLDWVIGTTTGVDKTKVRRLGIEINGDGGTTWSNPTVVNIDSITVTTASLSFTFDTTATVYATPAADRTADRAMWLNNGSSDTTALAGSSIAWSTTCP